MFVKDPAHGAGLNNATGWHRDLQLVPLDTRGRGYVTFWCPYERPLGEGDSFLHFAVGSQRDIGFEYWYGNPEKLGPLIAARYRHHKGRVIGCRRLHGPRRLDLPHGAAAGSVAGRARRGFLCGNQNITRACCIVASSSTPSTRCLLDGVALPVPHRSTEPARQRHRREMT